MFHFDGGFKQEFHKIEDVTESLFAYQENKVIMGAITKEEI